MRAIGFNRPLPIQHADALLDIEVPLPEIGEYDILVKIQAVAVNPADIKIRAGHQPTDGQYRILGYDAAGIIEKIGNKVKNLNIGDYVYYAGAINRAGSNAEYQAVDSRLVAKMPENLTFAQAAALPLTMLTAWETLFDRLNVQQKIAGGNRTIFIIGGAGGVGSATIQLTKALTDLTVVATASRPESIAWCQKMGADFVINHHQPFKAQFEEQNINVPEFIFSTNHSEVYLPQIADIIVPQGKLALIDDPECFDIRPLKSKCISTHWEFMFTRSLYATADIAEQGHILQQVCQLLENQQITTTVTQTLHGLNAENLKQAHAMIENGDMIGKVVITV